MMERRPLFTLARVAAGLAASMALVASAVGAERSGPSRGVDAASGSGWFAPAAAGRGRALFAFDAGRASNGTVRGRLRYIDESTGMRVTATRVTDYRATTAFSRFFAGEAEIGGVPGFTFYVEVFDDAVGGADRFRIELSNGYVADSGGFGDQSGGTGLDGGDVWIGGASGMTDGVVRAALVTGRIEEDDPSIRYTAADLWYDRFSPGFSEGKVKASPHAGQTATLTFTGTGVDWIGYRAVNTGIARVYLDGRLVAEVDTFLPVPLFQVPLYSARGLASGTHTLTIEVTGTFSTPIGAAWIAVDAFDVTP